MNKPIPLIRCTLGEPESLAVERVLRSGWLTQGPEVLAFENEFANFVGAKHACAVSNCTVALHLALKAVGVQAGDEVITVSHSFIATANSIRYCGATPIFVDVLSDTGTLDPNLVAKRISSKTKALLVVHQIGMPCDMAAIVRLAREHRLAIVEDAACAIGTEILWEGKWEKIGKPHGDIACFSFHPRKLLTTGDGGMLTTSNPDWDKKFRLWRQHGMSVSDSVRHSAQVPIFESYVELGFNYRMTDLQAAIGREQLKRIDGIILKRRTQAAYYQEQFALIEGLRLPRPPQWAKPSWQSYCIGLPDFVPQFEFMQAALNEGIATRRGVHCAHREPAYQKEAWSCESGQIKCVCGNRGCGKLKSGERIQDHSVILPLFHDMTEEQQKQIVDFTRGQINFYRTIHPRDRGQMGLSAY